MFIFDKRHCSFQFPDAFCLIVFGMKCKYQTWMKISHCCLFCRSVMSDSLRPHGLKHTRLPCPSPSPGAWSRRFHMFGLKDALVGSVGEAWLSAAESLQSCPTLCDPINGSPPGSPVPGILQARTLEWVTISFSNAWKWKVKVKSLSRVQLCATPWIAAFQAPLSMGFSRQGYWSGVPLPSPTWLSSGWI